MPVGLVAILYVHADEGGGYGRWVDLLEDCPNLAVSPPGPWTDEYRPSVRAALARRAARACR